MNHSNPLRALIHGIVRGEKAPVVVAKAGVSLLDSAAIEALEAQRLAAANALTPEQEEEARRARVTALLDDVGDPGSNYAETDAALKAASAIYEWAETDDLGEGEGYADRLLSLLAGAAGVDTDEDLTEDEADALELVANSAWDFLEEKGASEDDIGKLLNDWDEDTAVAVHELIVGKLPDGDEEAADDIDSFAFGDGDGSDEAALDAVYRKKIVIRKGKKKRINKRVAGRVILSAKQKVAVRKMLKKSHNARATMRRAKSNRVRKQMGL